MVREFHEAALDLFNQHDYQVLKHVVGIVWADVSRKKPFSRAKDAESSWIASAPPAATRCTTSVQTRPGLAGGCGFAGIEIWYAFMNKLSVALMAAGNQSRYFLRSTGHSLAAGLQ